MLERVTATVLLTTLCLATVTERGVLWESLHITLTHVTTVRSAPGGGRVGFKQSGTFKLGEFRSRQSFE